MAANETAMVHFEINQSIRNRQNRYLKIKAHKNQVKKYIRGASSRKSTSCQSSPQSFEQKINILFPRQHATKFRPLIQQTQLAAKEYTRNKNFVYEQGPFYTLEPSTRLAKIMIHVERYSRKQTTSVLDISPTPSSL